MIWAKLGRVGGGGVVSVEVFVATEFGGCHEHSYWEESQQDEGEQSQHHYQDEHQKGQHRHLLRAVHQHPEGHPFAGRVRVEQSGTPHDAVLVIVVSY